MTIMESLILTFQVSNHKKYLFVKHNCPKLQFEQIKYGKNKNFDSLGIQKIDHFLK